METRFLADAERFKTPSKKRKAAMLGEEGAVRRNMVTFETHRRELPAEGDPGLDVVIADGSLGKGGLTKIVARLESSMVELGKALVEMATVSHDRFVEHDENLHLVTGAVQNLVSSLGPTLGLDPRFEAPTLWGTASFIGDEVVKLGEDAEELKAQVVSVREVIQHVVRKVNEEIGAKPDSNEKMLKILTLVMNRVQALNPELDKMRIHIGKLEAEVTANVSERATKRA